MTDMPWYPDFDNEADEVPADNKETTNDKNEKIRPRLRLAR